MQAIRELNAGQKCYLLSVLSEINHHLEPIEQLLSVRWGIGTHLEFAAVELQELTRSKLAGMAHWTTALTGTCSSNSNGCAE